MGRILLNKPTYFRPGSEIIHPPLYTKQLFRKEDADEAVRSPLSFLPRPLTIESFSRSILGFENSFVFLPPINDPSKHACELSFSTRSFVLGSSRRDEPAGRPEHVAGEVYASRGWGSVLSVLISATASPLR